jgi:DNA-binding NarL/FixJ family response regulator
MGTRVLLVEDRQMVREGVRALLVGVPGLEVVAEATSGREAVQRVRSDPPDVVVMDVRMPDMNGVEATRQIRAVAPHVLVVALSMYSDQRSVTEMFRAGATGYVLKDAGIDELIRAIQTVMDGHMYLSPPIASTIIGLSMQPEGKADPAKTSAMTDRQREVLQLVAEGMSTKEIARRLHLSVKTIETHRGQIMKKLGVFSVAELTKFAIREGITSLED